MIEVGYLSSILLLFTFALLNSCSTTAELTTITPDPTETPDKCHFYTGVIPCKMAGCEFNMTSKTCFPIKKCTNDTSLTACRRGNAYYTVGGVACISPGDEEGDCEVEEVLMAVNIHGHEHTDSKHITHLADFTYFWTDDDNTRQDINVETWYNSHCMNGVTGIPEEDKILYSSLIVGRNQAREPGRCITYNSKIPSNGRYEFNVRTVETFWVDIIRNRAKPRQFNIRLNGRTIWLEFNILHRASACQGIELVAEFDVTDGKLTPAGLPSTTRKGNAAFEVQFCYGDGDASSQYDPNYTIASFYIVKLKPSGMPLPPQPPTFPTTRMTTRRTTTQMTRRTTTKRKTTTPQSILSTTLKPVPPGPTPSLSPGGIFCRNKNKQSICHCLDPHNRCDLIYQPGGAYGDYHCVKRLDFCHDLEDYHLDKVLPPGTCMRARATYSYGGFICNNEYKSSNDEMYTKDDVGECVIQKTILAICFNSNISFTDSRNVTFVPMSQNPPNNLMDYEFSFQTLGAGKGGNTLCHEAKAPKKLHRDKDREMWINYVTGKKETPGPYCFNYSIPIEEDGTYELSLKTLEYESAEKDERAFNVFLNGIHVFREIQPIKIWQAVCVAIDLISVFEVTGGGTMVTPRGFPTYPIQKGGLEVAFCNGQCTIYKRKKFNFIGVAFSVIKLYSH